MPIDPETGVYIYAENETVGRWSDFLNKLSKSLQTVVRQLSKGRLVATHDAPWNPDRRLITGDLVRLYEWYVPDPGFPYKIGVEVTCEMGGLNRDTRYDLSVGYGGSPGGTYDQQIGFHVNLAGESTFQQYTGQPIPTILTGPTRIAVMAGAVYGPSPRQGVLTQYNARLRVAVYSA
jgi:hypothetical protein